MSVDIALEDIALGEADIQDASQTIASCLEAPDDGAAHDLYEALRSWTWKALENRRRDKELVSWLDVIGRVSSHLDVRWSALATKLEAFAELVQVSIMVADGPGRRDLLTRKHVREVVTSIYRNAGRLSRRSLIKQLGLRDPNLSRIVAPLRDEGWILRQMIGREVVYCLTDKGRRECVSLIAHEIKTARPVKSYTQVWATARSARVHANRWAEKITQLHVADLNIIDAPFTAGVAQVSRFSEDGPEKEFEHTGVQVLSYREGLTMRARH